MRTIPILVWAAVGFGWAGAVSAQAPVPLADAVEEPLLPSGISDQAVELFGSLAYLWTEEDGTEVVHLVGEFELHVGQRRLRAGEAVLWMSPRTCEGRSYNYFELFLWRDARIVEPAGTATTGPVLFATLSSFGKVTISADRKTRESSGETPIYAEAARVRRQIAARLGPKAEAPSPVTVLDLGDVTGER